MTDSLKTRHPNPTTCEERVKPGEVMAKVTWADRDAREAAVRDDLSEARRFFQGLVSVLAFVAVLVALVAIYVATGS